MNRTVTLTAAVCLLALAGCTPIMTSGDSQPSTSVTTHSTIEATDGPATPEPKSTAILPKMTVAAWWKANGGMLDTLQNDVNSVTNDQNNNDNLSSDCQELTADQSLTQSIPPIPSAAAQNAWSSALQTLRQGSLDCNGGFSDNQRSEISDAVSLIQSGGALLTQTKQLIKA